MQKNENQLSEWMAEELEYYFNVQREVTGTHCSGRRMRIDLLLTPRPDVGRHESHLWKTENPVLGIEVKRLRRGGWKAYSAHLAQAVDYTHVQWDGYGAARIFTFSPPDSFDMITDVRGNYIDQDNEDRKFRTLIWQLGVGELAYLDRDGWTLLGQSNHVLWSEARGVHEAKRWDMSPKLGSR